VSSPTPLAAASQLLDPEARRQIRLRGIVTLEVIACFAIPVLALVGATVFAPIMLGAAIAWGYWQEPLALLLLGWAGVAGVGRLLQLLWTPSPPDSRRWLTLSGTACGCAASILRGVAIWMHRAPGGLEVLVSIVYLPLACALHLVFLNRRSLFCFRRHLDIRSSEQERCDS
jgi:hypothetical protein